MIWEKSIEPRVVRVNMMHRFAAETGEPIISWRVTRNPAPLDTSIEARQAFLRHYKMLRCVAPVAITRGRAAPSAMVYFHPRMDVLGQDFEVIIPDCLRTHQVRRPGIKSLPRWPARFFDIFSGERPLAEGSFDPLYDLHHIHLDVLMKETDLPGVAHPSARSSVQFMMDLLDRQAPNVLETVTLKITMDPQISLPTSTSKVKSFIYRLVRCPDLPIPKPSESCLGTVAKNNVAVSLGIPCYESVYTKLLAEDGAVFRNPLPGKLAVLQVVDPINDMTVLQNTFAEFQRWPMLFEGGMFHQPEAGVWLGSQMSDPMLSYYILSPWGLCGINYGMGDAKVY